MAQVVVINSPLPKCRAQECGCVVTTFYSYSKKSNKIIITYSQSLKVSTVKQNSDSLVGSSDFPEFSSNSLFERKAW